MYGHLDGYDPLSDIFQLHRNLRWSRSHTKHSMWLAVSQPFGLRGYTDESLKKFSRLQEIRFGDPSLKSPVFYVLFRQHSGRPERI
jgi:hypothetical protein